MKFALENDLDYAFSYFDLTKTPDVLGHFGRVFDPSNPTHTTSVVLVKTELAKEVGYKPPQEGCAVSNEDMHFTLGCVAAGAKIGHLPEQTWWWRWDRIPGDPLGRLTNTSGLPTRW